MDRLQKIHTQLNRTKMRLQDRLDGNPDEAFVAYHQLAGLTEATDLIEQNMKEEAMNHDQ